MKSTSIILFALIFFYIGEIQAQNNNDAYSYLEAIGNQFYQISDKTMSYVSAASHGKSARKVEKRRLEVIATIKEAEITVRRMKAFNKDAALRDSVVSYLRINRLILTEDFSKIVNMEEIAEQSYDAMEAYLMAKERASEKLDAAFEKVKEQQNTFAQNNNIKFSEGSSRLTQKVETSGKVLNYHDKIFLLFFKSFKNEAYLMDAINRNDINAIEQTRNTLLENAEKDLQTLGPISPFKTDASLKNACQQMLTFYKMEASQKIPDVLNLQLKKEEFEKIKSAFDAKRQGDRTQKDIDTFNKSVKEYNDTLAKVNSMYSELNKKRSVLLDQWNKASTKFLDTHIPKYN
jgi:hypothetical protein